jgi:hypothetical protein
MRIALRSALAAVSAAALLAACGGGSGDEAPPARGTIITAVLAGQATTAQIDAGTASKGIQALTGAARCNVDIRYVIYMTRDPAGEPATASAGVLVPSGTDAACTGERPVVLYAHGTSTVHAKNMASVTTDSEASLMMAMYAAQGFIVVAPNYLGYDKSSLNYHPYLNAEASAVDMIDGLRAAKAHLAAASTVKPSTKLLITGYSQGGHVALATHKVMERDYGSEFTVTASGPMSGPYNLQAFMDTIMGSGPVAAGALVFAPMLLTSFQASYGNVYTQLTDVFQSPYAATAERLFPTDTAVDTLMAEGKLPADPTLTKLFGTGGLITDAFRSGYTSSGLRTDAGRNTLLGFTPKRANTVALCGGAQDPTVFFSNTTSLQADLASRSFLAPAWNLEDRSTLPAGTTGDQIWGGFQQAKAAAGANVQAQYHGTLVPPFCTALVRGLYQQVLAAGL